jgi:nucleotide-binding universal stress UspA family protein
MDTRILMAVDGSDKGFEAVSILGRLLKDQPGAHLTLFHCLQQLQTLAPGELVVISDEAYRLPISAQEKLGNAVLEEAHKRLVDSEFPEAGIHRKLKLDSVDAAQDILREAEEQDIPTIAVGRRGRTQLESLLLGSVSSKVAQYARGRAVWIVDSPIHETRSALIAMEGAPDAPSITAYTSRHLAPIPNLRFTLLHLMPPMPPTLWDDGHILTPAEQRERQSQVERWRTDWAKRINSLMEETRCSFMECRVPEEKIESRIVTTREGIARDLLNVASELRVQMVVLGKRSFRERKPFLLGSHANKILQNAKGSIICLVDSI